MIAAASRLISPARAQPEDTRGWARQHDEESDQQWEAVADTRTAFPGFDAAITAKTNDIARIRVGCSGWDYAEWKDPIYEGLPERRWFEFYSHHLDTVEINAIPNSGWTTTSIGSDVSATTWART